MWDVNGHSAIHSLWRKCIRCTATSEYCPKCEDYVRAMREERDWAYQDALVELIRSA